MQYSNYDMKNNVHATLSTAVSSVATTIQLTSGQGSRFGTTFPQIATLESFDENGKVIKREIVKITGRSGDNLTVVRAFAPCPENDDANSQTQNAISFNADDTISLYIPKEIFDKIADSLNDIYDNGTNNMRTELVSGLQVQVNPGNVMVGSAYYDFAGGTITLTDNATNYLEIDEDGNLANNTTGRNDENAKLAIITTSGGSVTNIKDRRLGTVGGKIGGVNIHDLTEKIILSPDDEFIVADSDNIYNNKKVKFKNILPASLIRQVILGENVTAGDGNGACYIGSDGKAYLSSVAGHNYCDGIVIDSGNTGDQVRMIISGFVPNANLTGTSDTVNLSYSSTNTNTGYNDYINIGRDTSGARPYNGVKIKIGTNYVGMVLQNNALGFNSGDIKYPLYGLYGTASAENYGVSCTSQIYYVDSTGHNGTYGDNENYKVSGCELGKKVAGGFIFNPRPVEALQLGFNTTQNGILTSIQSNFDGEKTLGILTAETQYNTSHTRIDESYDNTNRQTVGFWRQTTYSSSSYYGDGGTIRFRVKKGCYYRIYVANNRNYAWGGIISNE